MLEVFIPANMSVSLFQRKVHALMGKIYVLFSPACQKLPVLLSGSDIQTSTIFLVNSILLELFSSKTCTQFLSMVQNIAVMRRKASLR